MSRRRYLSGRETELKLGVQNFSENKTVLEVTAGRVGFGTTLATTGLDVYSDALFNENVTFSGLTTFTGISTFSGDVGFKSTSTASFDGPTFLNSDNTINGISTFNGVSNFDADIIINDISTFNGISTFNDTTTFNSDVIINGDGTSAGIFTFTGITSFTANSKFTEGTEIIFDGNTVFNGESDFNGDADFNVISILNGDTQSGGIFTFSGGAIFDSSATFNSDTLIQGVSTFAANTIFNGESDFNGDADFNVISILNGEVKSGGIFTFTGISSFTGSSRLSGQTVFDGNTTFEVQSRFNKQLLDYTGSMGSENQTLVSIGNSIFWADAADPDAISGISVLDESILVGTANSINELNFVGGGVIADAAVGSGIATITISGVTPAGNNASIQYNDNGSFGGADTFLFIDTLGRVGVGTTNSAEITNTFTVVGDVGITSAITTEKVFVTDKTPTELNELASKEYVDLFATASLQVQEPVAAAATVNLVATYVDGPVAGVGNSELGIGASLHANSNGILVIDGYTPIINDRILIKHQDEGLRNGFYNVKDTGSVSTPWILERSVGADEPPEIVEGAFTFVTEGVVNAASGFVLTDIDPAFSAGGYVGLSTIEFQQFSAAGQVEAGDGLFKVGSVINVGTANSDRIVVNEDDIDLAPVTTNSTTLSTGDDTFVTDITTDGFGRITDFTSNNHRIATSTLTGVVIPKSTAFSVNGSGVLDFATTANGTNITLTGNLNAANVTATTTVSGNEVSATTNISAGSELSGSTLDITNGGTFGTSVNSASVTASGAISGGTVSATGTVSGGTVTSSGNMTATGTVSGGTVTSSGNVSAGSQLSGATLTVSGNATVNGDLRVDNGSNLRIGDGAANERILIQKADNNVSDHIIFYNGTTRIGEIGCQDTTWLRINQVTAKNIYTPRYIRSDGGFFVDGTSKGINGSGNFIGGTIAGASDYGTLLRSDASDTFSGGALSFGSTIRQMLNLWSTSYALGVQSSTLYYRSGSRFSWFRGGSHNDSQNNAGGGTVAMTLDANSDLTVTRNVSANAFFGDGSNLTGIVSGVVVQNTGSTVISAATTLDFRGSAITSIVDAGSGIARITIDGQDINDVGSANQVLYKNSSNIATTSANLQFNGTNLTCAGTVTANSDERLKENVETISDALEKVKQLRGVEYDHKNTGDHCLGVIAQEIEKVVPDVVYEDAHGIKSVAYQNIVALLIEAVKDQQKEIEELKRKLN